MELYSNDSLIKKASNSFMSQTFAFFGLAICLSGFGVYIGYNWFFDDFIKAPFLMIGILAVELILIFTSHIWSTKIPLAYFLFSAFAIFSGVSVVPVIVSVANEFGSFDLIYRALFASTALFFSMAIIALKTKQSLSGIGGFLSMSLVIMFILGIMSLFFPWGNIGEMVYSGFGMVLFSAFIAYDIQKIKMSQVDNPMMAAISLYLNMMNLFIFVVRFLTARSRD